MIPWLISWPKRGDLILIENQPRSQRKQNWFPPCGNIGARCSFHVSHLAAPMVLFNFIFFCFGFCLVCSKAACSVRMILYTDVCKWDHWSVFGIDLFLKSAWRGKLETKSYLTLRGRHMPKLTKRTEMLISRHMKNVNCWPYLSMYIYICFVSGRAFWYLLLSVPVLRARIWI